jgi:ATP-dependent Clp protease protease subunit
MDAKNIETLALPYEDEISIQLLRSHIHFLNGEINENSVLDVIKWITYENLDPEYSELTLYINSTGGNLAESFALIEIMKKSRKPIITVGIGSICSAAFLIFAAGFKGCRYISKTASIMCHQFSDGYCGKYHDIVAVAKENNLANQRMLDHLKECTGLDSRSVKSKFLSATDSWFTAEEIIDLGVADKIF